MISLAYSYKLKGLSTVPADAGCPRLNPKGGKLLATAAKAPRKAEKLDRYDIVALNYLSNYKGSSDKARYLEDFNTLGKYLSPGSMIVAALSIIIDASGSAPANWLEKGMQMHAADITLDENSPMIVVLFALLDNPYYNSFLSCIPAAARKYFGIEAWKKVLDYYVLWNMPARKADKYTKRFDKSIWRKFDKLGYSWSSRWKIMLASQRTFFYCYFNEKVSEFMYYFSANTLNSIRSGTFKLGKLVKDTGLIALRISSEYQFRALITSFMFSFVSLPEVSTVSRLVLSLCNVPALAMAEKVHQLIEALLHEDKEGDDLEPTLDEMRALTK